MKGLREAVLTNHSPHPRCGKCAGENIVNDGRNSSGNPRYLYPDCGACRVFHSAKLKLTPEHRALIAKADQERNSLRSVARIFDISHVTIWKYLKKSPKPSRLNDDHHARASR
ncbi:MAG: hypothetical protein NZ585_02990 [Chloracidobacterium sp.]|nr:hypothetical protein [Chloracidobacterium sp.]